MLRMHSLPCTLLSPPFLSPERTRAHSCAPSRSKRDLRASAMACMRSARAMRASRLGGSCGAVAASTRAVVARTIASKSSFPALSNVAVLPQDLRRRKAAPVAGRQAARHAAVVKYRLILESIQAVKRPRRKFRTQPRHLRRPIRLRALIVHEQFGRAMCAAREDFGEVS